MDLAWVVDQDLTLVLVKGMKDHLYLQKDQNLAPPKVQIGLDLSLDLLQLNLLLQDAPNPTIDANGWTLAAGGSRFQNFSLFLLLRWLWCKYR